MNQPFVTSPCRVETFSKRNVTVFRDNFEALHFARQVAAVKNIQADSRPFYVMDVGRVSRLLDAWHNFLPRVRPFYAVNCNADDVLLKVLAYRTDVGLHCQTRQNLDKALEHVAPESILYSNACWTRSTAVHAAANDVRRLSFESARDLSRLVGGLNGASPASLELVLNVCVNGDRAESDDGFADVDTEAAFGCALADAPDLLQLAADMGAPCVGVAFTLGCAGGDAAMAHRYERAIAEMARLFAFARQIGAPLRLLNIGGDFSARADDHVVFTKICTRINESLGFHFPADDCAELAIIATPGRFVAESAFTLVTNVIGRRAVDASYITNDDFDAGAEAFIYETNEGYYGSFGCRINANCNPRCAPLFDGGFDSKDDEHVYGNVLGPTCDERFDLLESGCRFRPLHIGEWLMWADMGAYTLNNRADDEFDGGVAAANLPPAIFYFTSQRDWQRLNGLVAVEAVPPPSFYRDYGGSVGAASDDDDEGIRSASPASLASAEEDLFGGLLDDEYFDSRP